MADLITDACLIEKILNNDREAFTHLYAKYCKPFNLVCLRYAKNKQDAEDLLQEAFINIYKDLHQYDSNKAAFVHWAKRVVVNTCLQKLRKKSVFDHVENIFEVVHPVSVYPKIIEALKLEDLTKTIQKLPNGYRTVFNLYVIDGFKHHEIAELLNISIGTSKSQLMKSKKLLKKYLQKSDHTVLENYA